MRCASFLLFWTPLLTIILLVSLFLDIFTYEWTISPQGVKLSHSTPASCLPWKFPFKECSMFWKTLPQLNFIALILQLSAAIFTVVLLLFLSIAGCTKLMERRIASFCVLPLTWAIFVLLLAAFLLRFKMVPENSPICFGLRLQPYPQWVFFYHKGSQVYCTIASIAISVVLNQLISFLGYLRPLASFSFDLPKDEIIHARGEEETKVKI